MDNEITREELDRGYIGNMTIGDLKKFIEKYNLPDDGKILIQRVEDRYFEPTKINGSWTSGWSIYPKEGESYYNAIKHNKRIDEEYYSNKEEFYNLDPLKHKKFFTKYSQKELDEMRDQYVVAWSAVKYKYEDKNLLIDLHY